MWHPISKDELLALIADPEIAGNAKLRLFWELIRIAPEKWSLSPWGDEGGGFWVVAVLGSECVYFNDIEEGFNLSPYEASGVIGEYYCDQAELRECLSSLLAKVQSVLAREA
jgi:hypothetical protein